MANSRDRQILNSIINPLLPIGEGGYDYEEECIEDGSEWEDEYKGDHEDEAYAHDAEEYSEGEAH